MEKRKIKKNENGTKTKEEEEEGEMSETNNEKKVKPRNGSRTDSVIVSKIKKQKFSSSKKKKLAKLSGKDKSVNDIRNFFEIANPLKSNSDMEKSDQDGSCGIKAKNNTNQCLAKEHQQLPMPTQDTGLSGRCKVPRDSSNEESGLKPRENEKQVRRPTLDAQDIEEITSVDF